MGHHHPGRLLFFNVSNTATMFLFLAQGRHQLLSNWLLWKQNPQFSGSRQALLINSYWHIKGSLSALPVAAYTTALFSPKQSLLCILTELISLRSIKSYYLPSLPFLTDLNVHSEVMVFYSASRPIQSQCNVNGCWMAHIFFFLPFLIWLFKMT